MRTRGRKNKTKMSVLIKWTKVQRAVSEQTAKKIQPTTCSRLSLSSVFNIFSLLFYCRNECSSQMETPWRLSTEEKVRNPPENGVYFSIFFFFFFVNKRSKLSTPVSYLNYCMYWIGLFYILIEMMSTPDKSTDPSCCNWIRVELFIRLIYSGDSLVLTPNA